MGKKERKWEQTNKKSPNLKHRKVPPNHKRAEIQPRLSGSRVQPLNHYTPAADGFEDVLTYKKWTKWEMWVKFCLGQYEDCSLGDSTSDSSERLFQRGREERQCICDFGKRGIHGITTNEGNSSSDGSTRPPDCYHGETCMQIKKQQFELDMEQQTGSKSGKEYAKAVCCHPTFLTYMQSTSCEMLSWMKHKLESRFPGEISTTSNMQIIPL